VINGHRSGTPTDSPDGGTGKTSLGGGMQSPSASRLELCHAYTSFVHRYTR